MIQKVFSIRDTKGDVFNQPFHVHTHAEAERMFHRIRNDDKSTVNAYPEDFDLYFLGEFDTTKGQYKPLDAPQHMIGAIHVKAAPQQ